MSPQGANSGSADPARLQIRHWNYVGSYTLRQPGLATLVIQFVRLRWYHRAAGRAVAYYVLWRIVRHG